jgi:hypothetical protein
MNSSTLHPYPLCSHPLHPLISLPTSAEPVYSSLTKETHPIPRRKKCRKGIVGSETIRLCPLSHPFPSSLLSIKLWKRCPVHRLCVSVHGAQT